MPQFLYDKLQQILSSLQQSDVSRINTQANEGGFQSLSSNEDVPALPKQTIAIEDPLTLHTPVNPAEVESVEGPNISQGTMTDENMSNRNSLSLQKLDSHDILPSQTMERGTQMLPVQTREQGVQTTPRALSYHTNESINLAPTQPPQDVDMESASDPKALLKQQCPTCKGYFLKYSDYEEHRRKHHRVRKTAKKSTVKSGRSYATRSTTKKAAAAATSSPPGKRGLKRSRADNDEETEHEEIIDHLTKAKKTAEADQAGSGRRARKLSKPRPKKFSKWI